LFQPISKAYITKAMEKDTRYFKHAVNMSLLERIFALVFHS